jgi:hypothetical protein
MVRLLMRSRTGNILLAVLGVVYAVGATIVLARFVMDVWNAASLVDIALQVCLLASAACGVWFVVCALENLGLHVDRRLHIHRR